MFFVFNLGHTESRTSFEQGFWIPGLYANLIKIMDLSPFTLVFKHFWYLGGLKPLD